MFEENTIEEVICQLRFPTILEIVSDVPSEFQNRIRDQYPIYQQHAPFANVPAEIADAMSNLPIPFSNPATSVTHSFDSEDEMVRISLASDFLAVTQKNYVRWETFRSALHDVRRALEDVYRPAFYTRIGLRYRDVVRRSEIGLADVPWHELLNPAFSGLLSTDVHDGLESLTGEAIMRVFPDREHRVKILYGLADSQTGEVFGIDMDFFTIERSDGDSVSGILDDFNRQAGNLFRWAIRPPLRDALRPRALEP